MTPTLGRQMHLCEFEVSLVYKGSSRTLRVTPEKPCFETPTTKKKKKPREEREAVQ